MIYFPQNPFKRPAAVPPASFASGRSRIMRDILWNKPVFKAPALPNPPALPEPLPFTATRITLRS